jgi:hypothetical protein
MAAQPRELYQYHKDAVKMYEDIKTRMEEGTLNPGDVLFYYTEYLQSIQNTQIIDILKDLLSTASLGITQQPEPVSNAIDRYVIDQNPSAPFGGDNTSRIQASYDLVDLYEECVELFSNKIIKVKVDQRYAFQSKYFYAFNQGLDCDFIITSLCNRYSDNNLQCANQGDYYLITT